MALPSFAHHLGNTYTKKPRIMVLEVKDPKPPYKEVHGWLIVEREEKQEFNGKEIFAASIQLYYQRILPNTHQWDGGKEVFSGAYSRLRNAVSITSSSMIAGDVRLGISELYGHRIGTYLMNEIVHWVKQWPDAKLKTVRLVEGDGYGDNKKRRNWLYEQFGIEFDFSDTEQKAGYSLPMLAGGLNEVNTWKQNITEHHMEEFIARLLSDKIALKAENKILQDSSNNNWWKNEYNKAYQRPLRWALKIFLGRHIGHILIAIIGLLAMQGLWEYIQG